MVRKKKMPDALDEVARVIELADRSGDGQLQMNASLAKAELLIASDRSDEALAILHDVVPRLPEHTPDTYARHQRAMALAFYGVDRVTLAKRSLARSQQTYQGLHNVYGEFELTRVWRERCAPSFENDAGQDKGAADLLQDVAGLLLHAGRPRLVAAALVRLLEQTAGVVCAAVISRGTDGSTEKVTGFGSQPTEARVIRRVLVIGLELNRSIEVQLSIKTDAESIANLNAVTLLLSTAHDLERARAEREERLTLWPLEDPTLIAEQAVVMGRLSVLMADARRVAGTSVNVLITGESGTGKEILARAIHRYSARADRPFVPFNCAAVPREMLESQLFGHRRGAFTGADRDNPGVIRAASHGTLLLDEIGELSLELQPKLLRFLESGEISPLGDPNPMTVDVRIIAATNANLDELVRQGRFREDLFYRLNVIPLVLPPLRERRDEIPALVHHFVARAAQEFGKSGLRVAEETMEHLIVHAWPGNVRQLNNEVRRMVALAESNSTLKPSALSKEILRVTPRAARGVGSQEFAVPLTDKLQAALSSVEREMIKAALKTSDGRVDAAARSLGISRKGLYLKRQRLGL
jgi:DNA-binding NtrC family response regulator